VLTGALSSVDTTSADGRLFFQIIGAMAEFERALIKDRTIAGLAAAKAQGKVGGRPKAMDPRMIRQAQDLKAEGKSYGAIAKALGVGQTTVYRALTGTAG
jgi:DNA invertase Pin-like site-specific DNA recombinase